MFDKKKLNFWRLAILYAGFTFIVLFLLWSSPYKSKASMMGSSMGNMMKSMHMSNVTISGLLSNPSSKNKMTDVAAAHHENEKSPIYRTAILTTSIVFLLLPLVIGGSIILAIIWIK